jgi:hypothetical protein
MSYETRVQEVAQAVIEYLSGNSNTKDNNESSVILMKGRRMGSAEASGASRPAQKEFVKDVALAMRKLGYKKPRKGAVAKSPSGEKAIMTISSSWGSKEPIYQADVVALGRQIENIIGQAFPDSDPNDWLSAYFTKKGWDPYDAYAKLMPYVMKKHFNVKSLDDLMATIWDEHFSQAVSDAQSVIDSKAKKGQLAHPSDSRALADAEYQKNHNPYKPIVR